MKILIIISTILVSIPLIAQNNINSVLDSIEANNTTLKSLRLTADAQKLGNKTSIYLDNPEVEFNYLWGKPGNIGSRTDINIKQTFDIPTISGMKSRLANGQNTLIEFQYKADRMNILLEAKQYCIDLVYYNALKRELEMRLQHAETIAGGYKDRLDRGDANRLEYNKIQLNLASVLGELSRVEVERNALLSQLKRLNGGTDILLNENQYVSVQLPLNFVDWYEEAEQKNPVLAYIKQEIEVGKSQVSLSKASNWPTFSTGYMSEKVVGQQYQGFTVGISIPLWENKNRVKQAKVAVSAAESREADRKQQFYSQLQSLYNRANGLKVIAEKYRQSLANVNNTDLLKKALDTGEISLLDYIVEIGLYYTTVNQALEAERDYQKAIAELSAVEL
ncbi:TolC family protein [Macellibacteroides fermentans]|uniref:TolC family protein n=1 Tax=Macellibacteroides fermentans TaxID=879969 RepID=UPI00406CA891